VPAIILGILALNKIKKSPATLGGQGLAIAGLVTGAIGTLLTFITVAMLVPAVTAGRSAAYDAICLNNVKQIMVASTAYATAHDNTMPETLDQVKPYWGGVQPDKNPMLICHAAADQSQPSYEIVAPGKKLTAVANPSKTVFIREIQPNHNGRRAVGFMDGHVDMVRDQ
jgi:prepilin-type processing-associated H-X9-DG protein